MDVHGERSYASYVVRVWTWGSDDDAEVRVRVERVESGEQVDVRGDPACRLAATIAASFRPARDARTTGDRPREAVGPGSDLPARSGT